MKVDINMFYFLLLLIVLTTAIGCIPKRGPCDTFLGGRKYRSVLMDKNRARKIRNIRNVELNL